MRISPAEAIVLVALCAPGEILAAGGAFDGIYDCQVTYFGTPLQAYVTINGQPDGRAIYGVVYISPTQPLYGYGIGQITNRIFSGLSMSGYDFRVVFSASGNTVSGSLVQPVIGGTGTTNSPVSCNKIW